jgi:hypothetical protein
MLFVFSSPFAGAGREYALSSSKNPSGSFAGTANTDARYSTFNDVAGSQHFTYVNYASQSEKITILPL